MSSNVLLMQFSCNDWYDPVRQGGTTSCFPSSYTNCRM